MSTRRKFEFEQLDGDLLLAWGIVAFLAFLGIAAIAVYAGFVAQAMLQ